MNNYKLENLHWQEFEILADKCLKEDVEDSITFIDGGGDKGRDIVFTGRSKEFHADWPEGKWLFQVKHKSMLNYTKSASALVGDLETELQKTFLKHKFDYDYYILTTNLAIKGDLYDKLNETVNQFKKKHDKDFKFALYEYSQFSNCLDKSNHIKWFFPGIIEYVQSGELIERIINRAQENRNKAFISKIENNKHKFVLTSYFQRASTVLKEFNIVILSGPPKSGKTFNGEVLAFNYAQFENYAIVKVDEPLDVEKSYKAETSQIFICDDAFGTIEKSFSGEMWKRKLGTILSFADNNHKFIFTNREYIVRIFQGEYDEDSRLLLSKIIVESHNYTFGEKSALWAKYVLSSKLPELDQRLLIEREKEIVTHKNFSPETVRSYFQRDTFIHDFAELWTHILKHFDTPDAYIDAVFKSLDIAHQAVFVSILCAHNEYKDALLEKYGKIKEDLNISDLKRLEDSIIELDDSLVKLSNIGDETTVKFYHPSMSEYLVRQLASDLYGGFRRVVIRNTNLFILNMCRLWSHDYQGSISTSSKKRRIKLFKSDLDNIFYGCCEILKSERSKFHEVVDVALWFKNQEVVTMIKLKNRPYYDEISSKIKAGLRILWSRQLYNRFNDHSLSDWMSLIDLIERIDNSFNLPKRNFDKSLLQYLFEHRQNDVDYWMVVFKVLNYTSSKYVKEIVGRDWLNAFYKETEQELLKLGTEYYGNDFPDFKSFEAKKRINKRATKTTYKTSATWYPRYLAIKDRIRYIKDSQKKEISRILINHFQHMYEQLKMIEPHQKNRYSFNISQGWWSK